jgi:hypothetical protein
MKRIQVFSLLLISMSLFSQSQTIIEIKGGTNIANLSDPGNLSPSAVWETRLGFVGDISASYEITPMVEIQTGFRFSQKGTKSESTMFTTHDVHATLTNNYIEIPVYLKYRIIDFTPQLFVMGGPAYSYLTSSRIESNDPVLGAVSFDSKSDYKTYDFSLDAGLGLRTPINDNLYFVSSAIYSFGLVKISKAPSNEKTRDIKLSVGLAYAIK